MLIAEANLSGGGSSIWTAAIVVAGVVALGVLAYLFARRMLDERGSAVGVRGASIESAAMAQLAETIERLEAIIDRLEAASLSTEPRPSSEIVSAGKQSGNVITDGDRASARLRVVELAAGGMRVGEIARELNQPLGEVELILALERVQREG